jgi:hypothetical protein
LTRNIKLLKRVRKVLLQNPEKHKQATWMAVAPKEIKDKLAKARKKGKGEVLLSCTTTACVAGHACLLSGDKALIGTDAEPCRGAYEVDYVIDKYGEKWYIQDRAQDLMGLSYEEAEHLFRTGRRRDRLIQDIETLIAGGKIV